jgi:hypothetical protein
MSVSGLIRTVPGKEVSHTALCAAAVQPFTNLLTKRLPVKETPATLSSVFHCKTNGSFCVVVDCAVCSTTPVV